MTVTVRHGDCRDVLAGMADNTFHACVTDPPYGLEFMGKEWDKFPQTKNAWATRDKSEDLTGKSSSPFLAAQVNCYQAGSSFQSWCEEWAREVYRVLKPGAHLLAFGGTRTEHRLVCAIEDAGFEIRDKVLWLYGAGFPKSHDVSKAIDKALGADREVVGVREYAGGHVQRSSPDKLAPPIGTFVRSQDDRLETAPATPEAQQWAGWGTALKPAYELITVARKPLVGSVARNVLAHGTGGLNIDACRVPGAFESGWSSSGSKASENVAMSGPNYARDPKPDNPLGRWPANVCHDGSPEVLAAFAAYGERTSGELHPWHDAKPSTNGSMSGGNYAGRVKASFGGDTGTAARFFYTAKADRDDRADSKHPTVKPVDLMRWLVRLITPPGGHVLDPFAGSGTTGEACMLEGFDCTLIERDAQHVADIEHRMQRWHGGDLPLFSSWPPAETDAQDERMADLFQEAAD
jgi:DNA modification methylase